MQFSDALSKSYDQKKIEDEVRGFWEKEKIPNNLSKMRSGKAKYFLLDGPPYANAQPHVGHVKTTLFKDVWSRFKYLQGYDSLFLPGFDCHGLPTEVMVEKELGITAKSDIEKLGVEKFDAKCLEKVNNTEKDWVAYYRKLGAFRAYYEPYFTYKNYYIESGWWTAKKLHEKGLMVEGERPIHWCPHCETSLSGYEVSDSYKDTTDPSIFVKFKVKGTENEHLLVWTTTPWTLAANVAVFVHPEETYVKARDGKEILVLAKKRKEFVEQLIGRTLETISEVRGEDLDGVEYEPLLDVPQQQKIGESPAAHKIYLSISILSNKKYKKHALVSYKCLNCENELSDEGLTPQSKCPACGKGPLEPVTASGAEEFEEFVTMNEGSGLVHCAPGHGQTDNYVGKHYGLPAASPVDEGGKYTALAGQFAGLFVKKADKEIIAWLEEHQKMFHSETTTHRASVCWRCKTPLIFRLSKQWYLKVEPIKEKMIAANEKVKWLPEFGKTKFRNWLADRQDWCISQQRYWGIPMPIWICEKCGAKDVVGSVEELKKKAIASTLPKDFEDLHRHTVDPIKLKCSACGGTASRVKDIFNVWYDSGIAPWASLGYPFKNKELFDQIFPVDMVDESQDQIRGWFDSLMFSSMAVFDKAPYKAVSLNGWVLDEKGDKMSKSLGNVVPATEAIDKLSADAIRLYFCWETAPWEVQKFSFKNAAEVQRGLTIFWNTWSFYNTYAGPDFKPGSINDLLDRAKAEDKWILSRLNSVVSCVTNNLENFEFHFAGRNLLGFVTNDFSRWYVKLCRDRVSLHAIEADRKICLSIMHHVLAVSAKIFAPFTPNLSEFLFQQLKRRDSTLSEQSVHFSYYPEANASLIDCSLEEKMALAMKITEACNSARQEAGIKLRWPVREIVVTGEGVAKETVQLLGGLLKTSNNSLSVSFSPKEPSGKFVAKEFDGGKAFLDAERSPELLHEAVFRELTRAIQAERKKQGLVVADSIELSVESSDSSFVNFLKKRENELKNEVGAASVKFGKAEGAVVELSVEGVSAKASFSKK